MCPGPFGTCKSFNYVQSIWTIHVVEALCCSPCSSGKTYCGRVLMGRYGVSLQWSSHDRQDFQSEQLPGPRLEIPKLEIICTKSASKNKQLESATKNLGSSK